MNWKEYDFKSGRSNFNTVGRILKGNIFKCSFCGGKGILPGTIGTKCHVCRGTGDVSVKGPVIVCAYCRGLGNYPVKTNLTCPVCRGKGLIPVDLPVEKCEMCEGRGKVRGEAMPCRNCKGKGVVRKIVNSDSDKDGDYEDY